MAKSRVSDQELFDLFDEIKDSPKFVKKEPISRARRLARGVALGMKDIQSPISLLQGLIQSPATYAIPEEARKGVALPGQEARVSKAFEPETDELTSLQLLMEDDEISPPVTLPEGRRAFQEELESYEREVGDRSILQEAPRRLTRSLPMLALGGGAFLGDVLGREATGLLAKKGVEKLGGGEGFQDFVDLVASLKPSLSKTIRPTQRAIPASETGKTFTQKELVEGARRLGMTEEQIAPLVREGSFAKMLRKVSPGSSSAQKAIGESRRAAGTKIFQNLTEKASSKALNEAKSSDFIRNTEKVLSEISARSRNAIQEDWKSLLDEGVNGKSLMQFWDKINDYFREYPKLQRLKDPIKKALLEVDPSVAKDFEIANTLSSRSRSVQKAMKPTTASKLFDLGELGEIISSVYYLDPTMLGIGLGSVSGRKLAELMTVNPRFQNLHKKLLTSVNAGQFKAAYKIFDNLTSMIAKDSPEMAAKMRKLTEKDMEDLLSQLEED